MTRTLLVRNKTIAVVSGNNEATKNVYEKLSGVGLGSLCANLGNKANIEAFFSLSPSGGKSISKPTCNVTNKELEKLEADVIKLYSSIIERAGLVSKIEELTREEKTNSFAHIELKSDKLERLVSNLSSKQCLEYSATIDALYSRNLRSFLRKIKVFTRCHFWPHKDFQPSIFMDYLLKNYYKKLKHELQQKIDVIDRKYPKEERQRLIDSYKDKSFNRLLEELNKQYEDLDEHSFLLKNYRWDCNFLRYYPIVLSTTHSLKYCSPNEVLYDYVIIDESSQVDLASSVIALSKARNVVIVGDSRQLPHVVPQRLYGPLDEIRNNYVLAPFIDYRRYSLLESVQVKYGNLVSSTLLNEHYRCDPEIIGFCNKRFYNNQLIIQTEHTDGCGIKIIETPSNTELRRTNTRQAEIIATEIMPLQKDRDEIGIVAPYRDQVSCITKRINDSNVLIDTVHKFQGNERNVIVLSSTSDRVVFSEDPEHIDFLNNPNLINVAISRAKKNLYVIASKELLSQEGTLLNDLKRYVNYYSGDSKVVESKVYSVFDLMFDDYAPILQKIRDKMLRVSQFESENIMATVIRNICNTKFNGLMSFKFNYPLNKIINAKQLTDSEERNFVLTPGSHCDFVIYDKLDKHICLIVEVDGKQHEDHIQKQRDTLKDKILKDAGLKILRIKTTDVNVEEKIEAQLN